MKLEQVWRALDEEDRKIILASLYKTMAGSAVNCLDEEEQKRLMSLTLFLKCDEQKMRSGLADLDC